MTKALSITQILCKLNIERTEVLCAQFNIPEQGSSGVTRLALMRKALRTTVPEADLRTATHAMLEQAAAKREEQAGQLAMLRNVLADEWPHGIVAFRAPRKTDTTFTLKGFRENDGDAEPVAVEIFRQLPSVKEVELVGDFSGYGVYRFTCRHATAHVTFDEDGVGLVAINDLSDE